MARLELGGSREAHNTDPFLDNEIRKRDALQNHVGTRRGRPGDREGQGAIALHSVGAILGIGCVVLQGRTSPLRSLRYDEKESSIPFWRLKM